MTTALAISAKPAEVVDIQEEDIFEHKPNAAHPLVDVGLRFNRASADDLMDGWRAVGYKVRVHHRYVKADGVSLPVFLIVARRK